MKNNKLITEIISRKEFAEQPPVLVDVGASGKVHQEWAQIAPYSICLAFDGDDREMKHLSCIRDSGYKELFVYHRVLTEEKMEKVPFYLTESPFCSSLLPPDLESLKPYVFRDLFLVKKQPSLKAITLTEVLQERNLTYVDWFKTDSQGTDLRLFRSLGQEVISTVKIAEFEPGIIDAYSGEDKFADLLKFMQDQPFFLEELQTNGVHRIQGKTLCEFKRKNVVLRYLKPTPGWVNALFLNNGVESRQWSLRDALFFLVCCILRKQFGMCYEFSTLFRARFPEEEQLFDRIRRTVQNEIRVGYVQDFRIRIRNRVHWLIDKIL